MTEGVLNSEQFKQWRLKFWKVAGRHLMQELQNISDPTHRAVTYSGLLKEIGPLFEISPDSAGVEIVATVAVDTFLQMVTRALGGDNAYLKTGLPAVELLFNVGKAVDMEFFVPSVEAPKPMKSDAN